MSMQSLYLPEIYGASMALKIESMGASAVRIANRWTLGWQAQVIKLLVTQQFLEKLRQQIEIEQEILSQHEMDNHLSEQEILELHQIAPQPPLLT